MHFICGRAGTGIQRPLRTDGSQGHEGSTPFDHTIGNTGSNPVHDARHWTEERDAVVAVTLSSRGTIGYYRGAPGHIMLV